MFFFRMNGGGQQVEVNVVEEEISFECLLLNQKQNKHTC
jgi:hypothetical protein